MSATIRRPLTWKESALPTELIPLCLVPRAVLETAMPTYKIGFYHVKLTGICFSRSSIPPPLLRRGAQAAGELLLKRPLVEAEYLSWDQLGELEEEYYAIG